MAKKSSVRGRKSIPQAEFGTFCRARRESLGMSLSEFCRLHGLDKGNHSRLERGLLSPPQDDSARQALAKALKLAEGSPNRKQFDDLAIAETGRLPQELRGGLHAASRSRRAVRQATVGNSARRKIWTTERHLELWAEWNESSQLLPQLIRMLVRATIEEPSLVRFSAGEGVQRHGWDGLVEIAQGNDFVPNGISGWELSVNKSPTSKANEDFEQRAKEARGTDVSRMAFVFVTPCKWDNKSKNKWCEEKRSLKIWGDVIACDSTDLEQWLETAPAVDQWFARRTGLKPEGVTDLSDHWENLKATTAPALAPEVFLASREVEAERLQKFLGLRHGSEENAPSKPLALEPLFAIESTSPNDALDFAAAMVASLADEDRDRIESRLIIVETIDAWRDLCVSQNRLVLLAHPRLPLDPESIADAIRHGHQVLLCSRRFAGDRSPVIELPAPRREDLEKALVKSGIDEAKAARFAEQSGRNLMVLKRHPELARFAHTMIPTWAESAVARELVPILLVGAWDDSNQADQEIVARLAGHRYHDVVSIATQWLNQTDPPIMRIQSTWSLVSREDSWFLLAPVALTAHDLNHFEEIALEVLGADDPKLELPIEQRWQAVLYGKRPTFSSDLRTGVAETLALLAAKSNGLKDKNLQPVLRARSIVRKLLEKSPWTTWSSLSPVLTLLAEAAPDEFLSAVENDLKQAEPATLQLFAESGRGDAMFGGCYHAGLLWALETVSWSPDHFAIAVCALGRIAERKPSSGNWGNNPLSTLVHIFLPWLPQTTADVTRRVKVLKILLKKVPDVGWKVLLNLLPGKQTYSDFIHRPQWQSWAEGFSQRVKHADFYEQQRQCAALLTEAIGSDVARIEQVIADLANFPPEQREQVLALLESLVSAGFDDESREQIVSAIRTIATRHRQHPNSQWVLPSEYVGRLEELQRRFEPLDITRRLAWLFQSHVELPIPYEEMDFPEQERRVLEMQLDAVRDVFNEGGLQKVYELAGRVKSPWHVGYAFGRANLPNTVDSILPKSLSSNTNVEVNFGRGFVHGRLQSEGRTWAETLPLKEWSALEAGSVLVELDFTPQTWDLVGQQAQEVQDYYWIHTHGRYRDAKPEDVSFAANQLLAYQRPLAAIDVLQTAVFRKCEIETDLVMKALEAARIDALSHRDGNFDPTHVRWEIGELIGSLQQAEGVDLNRLARIEFAYLALLDGHEAEPKTLLAMLRDDPTNFVLLIQAMFRSEYKSPDSEEAPTDEQLILARCGFELLNHWREANPPRLPGTDDDGIIDAERLLDWVNKAREQCRESGHLGICDEQLGEVLARDPEPKDPSVGWPSEPLRDLLEEINSESLFRGFEIGTFNKRGATGRSPTDGGEQERVLACRYRAYAVACHDEWPLIANSLRRIAEGYDEQAVREDEEAKRRM